ncbi:beta-lactamase/transpeptidase-like protein [Fusarium solani]|uniref:Beta-lactamase/transpeptidase-like protein n=1 Tax=Fusarium solani TaxID=169388 RepID=A0A9P9KTP8_FUSSL|nr:beta-lactamase/transpeptidase-like protein [Fusarium solani]KAH7268470.1 beta-lactamase/transpeptidase-like protein [Fusarium solani]
MLLGQETTTTLRETIDAYTQRPNGIPGLVYIVVDRDGRHVFAYVSGKRGSGQLEDMTLDTTFWIASCTKLVTTIAAMQLVESGKVRLDREEDIQLILPELSRISVVEEGADGALKLVDQQRKITLRMLLTHTAGFGYSFSNRKLKKWFEPVGINEFDDQDHDVYTQPLVNQPGSAWEYGIVIDWAGRLVERMSSLSLDDYCRLHIFEPLGIQRMTFFPTAEMKENLAYLHRRNEDGSIQEDTVKGGTAQMFSNQIPQFPDFARNQEPPGNPPQGWGLSFFSLLQPDPTGRAAGTAWWSGLANLIWWADVETGIGGMLATQILPYGDSQVFQCQADVERKIYAHLVKE